MIRATASVCPHCHADVPANVVRRDGGVWLDRTCPTHGLVTHRIAANAPYWADLDRFYFDVNDQPWPQRDFMVRLTEQCNLACPICLAKANTEDTPDLSLDAIRSLLQERRGAKIDLLAAEPTLREDLAEWVRTVKANGGIAALHTNGLKLANAEYARSLMEAGVDEVFLQFDGFDDAANVTLRGRPLLKARLAALANLRELGIGTSLIVVIARGVNEAEVARTFQFALKPENAFIREVFFLGLRVLGSAATNPTLGDQSLMPDDLIQLLCAQEPRIKRDDVQKFNMLYFAMLSAFRVRKCLYVQHYMVSREAGGYTPVSDILDLHALSTAAVRYANRRKDHPTAAEAGLLAALVRQGLRPEALRLVPDLFKLERLFQRGMNLHEVPERFLLLGFITACDPWNFDAAVAQNCGKGEVSADGGYEESGAWANVHREQRFATTARAPGKPFGRA